MKTPMHELMDMLQVQNPLRNQMLLKEKELIIKTHIEGQKSMNYGMNSFEHLAEDYYNKILTD
jgi:hypothetical protein